jgi:DNA polymerase (family X)
MTPFAYPNESIILTMTPSRNQALATEFQRIATVLEHQRANPFRVRAYRHAADLIARLTEDAGLLAQRGELIKVKGIGEDLVNKVLTFCEHGKIDLEPKHQPVLPPEVASWIRLPSFTASVVRQLYDRLHIRTLDDLELLVRSRFLRTLPEVTASEEELLQGITQLRNDSSPHSETA